MTAWNHILTYYIRPDRVQFVLAIFILAISVPGFLGALILGWPGFGSMGVSAWAGVYILRGNYWKARALAIGEPRA